MDNKEQAQSDYIIEKTEINEDNIINDEKDNIKDKASLGKFKSSEALLNAYNNLESEFTKRSQKLKDLENKINEDNVVAFEDKSESDNSEDKDSLSDDATAPEDNLPMYKQVDWQEKVAEFVRVNPIAKDYAEEVADIIMNDDALARDKQCLSTALNRVLAEKYRHPKELVKDKDFINEYIINNNEIKDLIISEYLDNLNTQNLPDVMIKHGEISLSPPHKPKTIAEAGEMAEKLLNGR